MPFTYSYSLFHGIRNQFCDFTPKSFVNIEQHLHYLIKPNQAAE